MSPLVNTRVATWADRHVVAALRRTWTEENAGQPVPDDDFTERFDAWLAREQEQRVTWLASVGRQDVGMLNLLVFTRMPRPGQPESRWGYVANVYVRAQRRDGGIGAELLAACTAYADAAGLVRLVLSPSPRSVPLYARAGFGSATTLMVRPGPS